MQRRSPNSYSAEASVQLRRRTEMNPRSCVASFGNNRRDLIMPGPIINAIDPRHLVTEHMLCEYHSMAFLASLYQPIARSTSSDQRISLQLEVFIIHASSDQNGSIDFTRALTPTFLRCPRVTAGGVPPSKHCATQPQGPSKSSLIFVRQNKCAIKAAGIDLDRAVQNQDARLPLQEFLRQVFRPVHGQDRRNCCTRVARNGLG
jgi:hypothetical protein